MVNRGSHGESVYINRFYSIKNGDLGSKHIFAGETRVVTKLEKNGGSIQSGVPGSIAFERSQGLQNGIVQGSGRKKGINRRLVATPDCGTNPDCTPPTSPPIEKFMYYYHGDHLGSFNMITDDAGAVYQHLEYFPYGETWVEEGGSSNNTPGYKFTGKELDLETGLYYYGARYYDPVLSRWISADPILGKYLPDLLDQRQTRKNWNHERDLPGMGGVFKPFNLGLYSYSHHNPLKFVDPDGRETKIIIIKDKFLDLLWFGSHAAISVDNPLGQPVLYDPAGSYDPKDSFGGSIRGTGDAFYGVDADLNQYIAFHEGQKSKVEVYTFATTQEQEQEIARRIEEAGGGIPLLCAVAVCQTVEDVGPFKNLGTIVRPGKLADKLQEIQSKSLEGSPSTTENIGDLVERVRELP